MSDNPHNSATVRLLAVTNNERGDLFTRLTKDLFFALGYDNLRLDVHKSGREVDIQGEHRFESRRVVAECKAHVKKMGGEELNKFLGVVTRERKKDGTTPVSGYFVSLGGFTETAIEQEIETGDDGLILLNDNQIVEELERCRVVVSRTFAVEQAGRCAEYAKLKNAVFESCELLGHSRGYVWEVVYTLGKQRTALALIHADGTPLAESVAQELIEADRLCGGDLHSLQYLPSSETGAGITFVTEVLEIYRKWLGEDCGYIQLDGLPADTDLSATRLKLERLFIPLKANRLPKPGDSEETKEKLTKTVVPISELLGGTRHIALLAAPGGGKSTLVKRLATAYAFPERRNESSDELPERDWLPLILRCRELRDRAHRPITELLDDIPLYVGMSAEEIAGFRRIVHTALRTGRALLLVDGLDEISDEGARQTFANHLRTLIAMFPQAALVVTSREAGFRLVAGVVASACEQAKLAPLDERDVLALCERWHVEVVGDTDKVRAEARELGQTIWQNERIRKLAENPLLLTTLLVVKRWVGELPRSRTTLYREAIRVLVRTWNVEGYAPLDEDETLAQLSYVACAMMGEGNQQIGQDALLKLLQKAREELEAELQFARISPREFVERIEYRSSLLMQTGHQRSNGGIEPVYEFRHLTFQEYLAARGYVEEQYPNRDDGKSLAAILEPRFNDEQWQEVIPLAAVLAGRKSEELISRLLAACEQHTFDDARLHGGADLPGNLLYQCIRDEVQVTAPTLRRTLLELPRHGRTSLGGRTGWAHDIMRGKFGPIFQDLIEDTYCRGSDGFEEYNSCAVDIARNLWFGTTSPVRLTDELTKRLLSALRTGERIEKIRAAFVCMYLAWEARLGSPETKLKARFQTIAELLISLIDSDDPPLTGAVCWALAWIGYNQLLVKAPAPTVVLTLFNLWRGTGIKASGRFAAWALAAMPVLPRNVINPSAWGDCDSFLRKAIAVEGFRLDEMSLAALTVGYYRRRPWNDSQLVRRIAKHESRNYTTDNFEEMLRNLGLEGTQLLNKWEKDRSANT